MKKKPQTAASLDVYSSGSIIGNDPYSMMRRSHSSSSNGSHGSHGSSTSNFGNMFQRVNSMFGVNSRSPTPSGLPTTPSPTPSSSQRSQKSVKLNYEDEDSPPIRNTVTTNSKPTSTITAPAQKNTKPPIVNKKQVIETEYASSSENDSFNLKTLEDLSDFSDEEVGEDPSPSVVVVKKQQQTKEPPKKLPSPTPSAQVKQSVVKSQPVKKQEQPKSKPLYREPIPVVEEDLSENENFSGDDFSDFGDDEEIVEEQDDDHNTTQSSFDDFEEEVVDDHHHHRKPSKNNKEEDFSDFEDSDSFEDFETSNDSFDDFEDEEEHKPPPKKDLQKPITIPTTVKPEAKKVSEPVVNNKSYKPEPKEQQRADPVIQKPIVTTQNETIRVSSPNPQPVVAKPVAQTVEESKEETRPRTNSVVEIPKTKPKEEPKEETRSRTNSVVEIRKPVTEKKVEYTEKVIEIPYKQPENKIEIVHEPEITIPVHENKEQIRVITIERPVEIKPKDVQSVSIGTDDLTDSRTYATQTAYHSQVFNTNYQGSNNNVKSPHAHLCCEQCNCNMYSPNFIPYYPPPLAYFRQPYAQAFPQRPLSSFSTFPRPYLPPQPTTSVREPTSSSHPTVPPNHASTTQTEAQPKPLFTRPTETETKPKEKFIFTPYIPNTKYLDEKNDRSNREYQRFKESFTSKVKEPASNASTCINEQYQKQTGHIRQELEEIKSLLLSSRQEMNMLLYNTRTAPSHLGGYPTTSPFEMRL